MCIAEYCAVPEVPLETDVYKLNTLIPHMRVPVKPIR